MTLANKVTIGRMVVAAATFVVFYILQLRPESDSRSTLGWITLTLFLIATVTDILARNRDNLAQTVDNLAPFVRVFTNTLGNGRWFDSFVDNLLPGVVGSVICGGPGVIGLPLNCAEGD
mgnify:CR=1 FL=1